MNIVAAMGIGFLLDCLLGDPHELPHPVRWIGSLIKALERLLYSEKQGRRLQMVCGFFMVLTVLLITGGTAVSLRLLSYRLARPAGILLDGILFYYCIAPHCLYTESMSVYEALPDSLSLARKRLSYIVGRDTQSLSYGGIIRAAVETVAENTSDGVTAPIFYMALGGPVLCFLYKAVNTMDSMTGYHNDRYECFGKAAARTDDVLNYIPSRLTAYAMAAGAWLLSVAGRLEAADPAGDASMRLLLQEFDWKRGIRIYKRDCRKHKSPNSAQTESMCAGVLGVELAGDASYFGVTVHKPVIGDNCREIVREDIRRANWLMYAASVLFLLVAVQIRIFAHY